VALRATAVECDLYCNGAFGGATVYLFQTLPATGYIYMQAAGAGILPYGLNWAGKTWSATATTYGDQVNVRIAVSVSGADALVSFYADGDLLSTQTVTGGASGSLNFVTLYGLNSLQENLSLVYDGTTYNWPWESADEIAAWDVVTGYSSWLWEATYIVTSGVAQCYIKWPGRVLTRTGTMLLRDSMGILWRADSTGTAITVQYQTAAPTTWSAPVTVASGNYGQPGIVDPGDGYLHLAAYCLTDSTKYQWRRGTSLNSWISDGAIT